MAKLKIRLTRQQQQYLAILLVWLIGGGYAYLNYFWIPTSKKIAATKKQIEEAEEKILKAKGYAGRLEKVEKEIVILTDQAAEAEKRLPKQKDFPAIIDTLNSLSQRYSVRMVSFSPGSAQEKQYFIETVYPVAVVGSYHDAAKFFAALALEQRIFNVRNVNYASPDEGGRLSINFMLVSYQYKG